MSAEYYFFDIERFVEWTYYCSGAFCDENDSSVLNCFSKSIAKDWRRLEKLPSKNSLNTINEKHLGTYAPFQTINIADFLLCVNMAKDHNRGNEDATNQPISSTGKKVLMILLLSRMDDKRALIAEKPHISENMHKNGNQEKYEERIREESPLYWHLSKTLSHSFEHNCFFYYPGRTFSVNQLDEFAERYSNRITKAGIKVGLSELVKRKLVAIVDAQHGLYKLDFQGCQDFLNAN